MSRHSREPLRSWLYSFQFKDIGTGNWLCLWMIVLRHEAVWAALVSEQGDRIRPAVGTTWICIRTVTGYDLSEGSWLWVVLEGILSKGPTCTCSGPTEKACVGWTARSQRGSLWVTHICSICLSATAEDSVAVTPDHSSFHAWTFFPPRSLLPHRCWRKPGE